MKNKSHVIIRFPPDVASRINEMFASGSTANDRLALTMNDDLRTGTVSFDGEKMPFTLYDLPTITEVMKTQDNINMYKAADICQMIVCSKEKDQMENAPTSELRQRLKEDDHGYKWPDGLCPPMKNAKELRFRKVKKKKYMDIPEVEKELKKLLRADLNRSVRWEVIEGEADVDVQCNQFLDSMLQDSSVQNRSAVSIAETSRPEIDFADLSLSEDGDDDHILPDREEDPAPKQIDFLMDLHLSSDSDENFMDDENSRMSNMT